MATIVVTPTTPGGIQGAVESTSPGDVILVKKGVYHESVFVDRSNIKIIADDEHVILDGNNVLPSGFILTGLYLDGVEINGFIIRNYTNEGILMTYCDRIRIISNKLFNTGSGIYGYICYRSLIWKNSISDVTGEGIHFFARDMEILENNVCNCSSSGIVISWFVIPINSIINNHCYKNGGSGIAQFYGEGDTVADNHCHDNGGAGIYCYGYYNSIINNHCYDNGGDGISINGFYNLLYNNKIHGNGMNIPDTGIMSTSYNSWFIENEIENNIFDGIWVIGNGRDTFIGDNKIMYNPGDGIKLQCDNNIIEDNKISKNQNIGLEITTNNNFVLNNEVMHNGQFDIKDTGSNNIFINNECKKDSPTNICQMCDE